MTEIKKEFAWLVVDAHGREIPEVETLFSRAASGGFGIATDRGVGRVRKIGHAFQALSKAEDLAVSPQSRRRATGRKNRTVFDEVVSFGTFDLMLRDVQDRQDGRTTEVRRVNSPSSHAVGSEAEDEHGTHASNNHDRQDARRQDVEKGGVEKNDNQDDQTDDAFDWTSKVDEAVFAEFINGAGSGGGVILDPTTTTSSSTTTTSSPTTDNNAYNPTTEFLGISPDGDPYTHAEEFVGLGANGAPIAPEPTPAPESQVQESSLTTREVASLSLGAHLAQNAPSRCAGNFCLRSHCDELVCYSPHI